MSSLPRPPPLRAGSPWVAVSHPEPRKPTGDFKLTDFLGLDAALTPLPV